MDPQRWQYTSNYLQTTFGREDDLLRDLRADALALGLPDISVSADVGRLLMLLARTTPARSMIEVGTLGGYSAIWLARALAPGGRLVTLEVDPGRAAFARKWFERAGMSDRIEVVVGAALDTLPQVVASRAPVDVLFLDAVKTEYGAYFKIAREAIAPGGMLIADNALGTNSWWIDDVGHADRDAVDAFNRALAADEGFDAAAVPLREGVLIARKLG